jgi:hypothetical protein
MVEFRRPRAQRVSVKRANPGVIAKARFEAPKRRGMRVNSCVPLSLEWDMGGEVQCGKAQTRVVGPYGCLALLPQNLEINQRVQLTNLVSSKSNPGVVVWRGNERAEGWELGIKLIDPRMDFWGIDL